MPITDYNARVDLGLKADPDDAIIEPLWSTTRPWLGAHGTLEAIITLPADSLRQATVTVLAVCQRATGHEARAVEVMTTVDFDAMWSLVPVQRHTPPRRCTGWPCRRSAMADP